MNVKEFELLSWESEITSACLSGVISNKLLLNGVKVSNNLIEIEFCDGIIQLDICEECFQLYCSSQGYAKVILFEDEDLVVFKNTNLDKEGRETLLDIYKYGAFYWKKEKFIDLLCAYNYEYKRFLQNINKEINPVDLSDLWLLNINHIISNYRMITVEELRENILTIYSSSGRNEEAEKIFRKSVEIIKKNVKTRIVKRKENIERIYVIFNNSEYTEWECLNISEDKIYYNLNDEYFLEVLHEGNIA